MIEQSYTLNRQNFLNAAKTAGAYIDHIPYKRSVDTDVDLVTDIAILGANSPKQIVIVSSGLHGVELPAGSLLQQIWLSEISNILSQTPNTKFLFVHALNPYGAMFGTRTDWGINGQKNIDPARNFIDFSKAEHAANYDVVAALRDADLSLYGAVKMWVKLLYSAFFEQGQSAFKKGFVRGQYTDPDIPYFGGGEPCLTRLTWEEILSKYVEGTGASRIWHLDCHTGDGPFGALQLYINDREGAHVYRDACQLMTPEKVQMTEKYFADISGDIVDYWSSYRIGNAQVTPMTLEFGTSAAKIQGIDVLRAILNRTILQNKFNDNHPKAAQIIQDMRNAFSPLTSEWEQSVKVQSKELWGHFARYIVAACSP